MKKILILLIVISFISFRNIVANPSPTGPLISELYFDENNEWYLELNLEMDYYWTNLNMEYSDSIFLITSADTSSFISGWDMFSLFNAGFVVITKDSLQFPFQIDKNGDIVRIICKSNGFYHDIQFNAGYGAFIFGNYPGSKVHSPKAGQSIKTCGGSTIVIDNNPTIGYDLNQATTSSFVFGYVYDSNHNPYPNVNVYSNTCSYLIITDSLGYFEFNAYACLQNIFAVNAFCAFPDTDLYVDTDSSYYIELTFDSCFVGINESLNNNNYSMQVFPNPSSGNFTFNISLPNIGGQNCIIRIYNAVGELVNIIPVNIDNPSTIINWNGKGRYSDLTAGPYTCALVVDGNVVKSQKLIIEK